MGVVRVLFGAMGRCVVLGVLVRLLARPLAKQEAQRSEEDTMTIELVLALLMNILYTAAPDAAPPEHSQMGETMQDVAVLRKLLVAMEREHGLDLLVYITQQVEESPSHRLWNLTLLEIFQSILSAQSPAKLVAAATTRPT